MKLNHKFLFAAFVAGSLFATGLTVQAQDSSTPTPPPAAAGKHGSNIYAAAVKQLDLTDDQKPKVKTILSDLQKKMKDLRNDDSLSAEDKRSKMKDLRTDANTQLKAVLTDDQYSKWIKLTSGHHRPAPAPSDSTTTNAPAN